MLRVSTLPARPHRARLHLAVAGGLAVLAGVVAAGPAPADAAPRPATRAAAAVRTVLVDPAACTRPAVDPAVAVVCTPSQVAAHLIDGATVVVSPGTHTGSLDLRGRRGLTLRGAGAVIDAGSGRYALSLRDVSDVRVEGLTLRGGSAQAAWVERTRGVTLAGVTLEGSAGAGLQLRDSARFTVTGGAARDNAAAGIMELTGVTGSSYERLVVTGNGSGAAAYNGDGLQLAGTGVQVRDVVTRDNGSSDLYEHGIYVASGARDVALTRVTSSGNSGVAVKLGGTGTLTDSTLTDDRMALFCGPTARGGWTVRATTLTAPQAKAGPGDCRLGR